MRQSEEQLMDENEMYWPEVDDIESDSISEATNDLGVDILDFCINQLDDEIPFVDEFSLEEDEFMVRIASVFQNGGTYLPIWCLVADLHQQQLR